VLLSFEVFRIDDFISSYLGKFSVFSVSGPLSAFESALSPDRSTFAIQRPQSTPAYSNNEHIIISAKHGQQTRSKFAG